MSDPYLIIEAQSAHDLAEGVTLHMSRGYRCQGGVAVATAESSNERKGYSEPRTIYAQAMTLTSADDVLGEAVEWETLDGLDRTTDRETAKNWAPNVGVRVVRRAKANGGAS